MAAGDCADQLGGHVLGAAATKCGGCMAQRRARPPMSWPWAMWCTWSPTSAARAAGADAGRAGRAGGAWIRTMAPSCRWSAASISIATSSTASPRRGASRARASSRSCIPRRWKKASRPPRSSSTCPSCWKTRGERGELAAREFRRRLRRPDAPARGAGAVAQPGVDPHPADHRPRCGRSRTPRSSASTSR